MKHVELPSAYTAPAAFASLGLAMAAALAALVFASPAAVADDVKDPVADKVRAAAAGRGPEVSIPFADHGGIRDFRAIDRDTLLVEGTHRRWYRVELMSGCFDLPFAQRVGFKSNPSGDFDRFSAVFVRGQRCAVKSVTETAPPATRASAKADATSAAPPAGPATEARSSRGGAAGKPTGTPTPR